MRSALAASRAWIAASRALATMGGGESMGDLHDDERYDAEDEDAELGGGDGVDRDDDSSGWYESVGDEAALLMVLMVLMVLMELMELVVSMSCRGPSSRSHPRGARSASKSTTERSTTLARELGIARAPDARPRARLR